MNLEPGTDYAGYRIIRELGRGGMGVVYEAEQLQLKRSVALKVLPEFHSANLDTVTRFSREAEAGARLHHPSIVQVYESGSVESSHYIAMEFIRGKSLAEVVENTKAVRDARVKESTSEHPRRAALAATTDREYIDWAVRTVIAVLRGLDHAHKLGVLHRDIKPQNLLLDEDGRVKIADFGLARLVEDPIFSQPGQPHGTPWYMSPEQVAVGVVPIDHRTDIYSTGVTLFELVTLDRPFPGDDITTVFRRILHKEAPSPRTINPRLPRDLETIVLKAIDKDPDRRYATATDFAEDLQRFLNFEDILARPVGPITRFIRRAARHKALTAVSAALILGVLVASVLFIRDRIATGRQVEAMLKRVSAFEEVGADERAESTLRELLAHVSPRHPEGTKKLGQVVRRRKARARALIAEAERLLLEQRFPRARAKLEEARRMDPKDPRIPELARSTAARRKVTIHVDGGDARVHASEYVQVHREFAKADLLGSTGPAGHVTATFVAGDYLISAVADDGRFTETWLPIDPLITVDEIWLRLLPTAGMAAKMVRIPAGKYPIGHDEKNQRGATPRVELYVDEFWIDRTEATQEDFDTYLKFLRRTGQRLPLLPADGWNPKTMKFEPKTANLPIIATWMEANRFLAFLGKRLPTETEWEVAARGKQGLIYPWGNKWDATKANKTGTAKPVGTHGGDGFQHGLYDMIGNVSEWTADRYLPYAGAPDRSRADIGVVNFDPSQRVSRGGGYFAGTPLFFMTAYFRNPRSGSRTGMRGVRSARPIVAGDE